MPPNRRARNSRVKEIGNPMKMTRTMPNSMIMPSVSLMLMAGSDLDLLVMHELFARPRGPQTFQGLGNTLDEQQGGRNRDHGSQRPDDRLPGAEFDFSLMLIE